MELEFPSIDYSEDDRQWMQEIYEHIKEQKYYNYRTIKTKLIGKIPLNYNPRTIDSRLIQYGHQLTLLGLYCVDPGSDYFEKTDKFIKNIKDILIEEPTLLSMPMENLSDKVGISPYDISVCLRMLECMGPFSRSTQTHYVGGVVVYDSFDFHEDQLFDAYYEYTDLNALGASFNRQEQIKNNQIDTIDEYFDRDICGRTPSSNIIFKSELPPVDLKMCFVLMPLSEEWSNRVYRDMIRESIDESKLQCLRADLLHGQIIIDDIWTKINQSAFVIVDVTGKNPNVMYELGIVHAIGKPAILITQNVEDIPFDFQHHRHYEYQDNTEGFRGFIEKMPEILSELYRYHYQMDINIV